MDTEQLIQPDLFPLTKGHSYTTEWYDNELLQKGSEYLFVFGDNQQRIGTGGQAVIRNEPNAFGLITKKAPSMHPNAFLYDDEPYSIDLIESTLEDLYACSEKYKLIFPSLGLGTGLSRMDIFAPKLLLKIDRAVSDLLGLDYRKLRK